MRHEKRWIPIFAAALLVPAGAARAASTTTHLPDVTVPDLVTLEGVCDGAQEAPSYLRVFPDASRHAFTVPTDRVFVITDVEWTAFPETGSYPFQSFAIFMVGAAAPKSPISVYRSHTSIDYDQTQGFSDGLAIFRDHITAGIPIGPGFAFDGSAAGDHVVATFGAPQPLFCDVHLRGYLTDAPSGSKSPGF